MAIQFPNFLGVPVRTPDYSGIGDIVNNYYAGKAMPQDALIKAVQAKFAEPTAEQGLLTSQLTNKKSQLEISKLSQEMATQRAFEQMLRGALGGNPTPATPRPAAQNSMPAAMPSI